jgi:hypothetical protein
MDKMGNRNKRKNTKVMGIGKIIEKEAETQRKNEREIRNIIKSIKK